MDAAGVEHATTVAEVDEALLLHALPIRRIHAHRGQVNRPGLFWSATTGGHVPYESWLELDRLWLADAAPEVEWIAAQPMWLRGLDGGDERRHVPDLLLSRRGQAPLVVDVKPEDFASQDEVRAVFDWTQRVCACRGWDYEVWTGASERVLPRVRAAGWARRAGHPVIGRLVATNPAARDSLVTAWLAGAQQGEAARGNV